MRHAIVLLVLGLAACGSPTPVPTASVCPRPSDYSAAEQQRLAAELGRLSADDVLRKVADEDHRLRVELKACRQ